MALNLGKKHYAVIMKQPRITEKATVSAEGGAYVFDVFPRATKGDVVRAVKELYHVTALKVRIAAIPRKSVFVRGRVGVKGGGKKAYVYLKKGEKIEIT